MKLSDEIKQIKTDKASLRSFGLVVGAIFFAIGALSAWKHHVWVNFFTVLGGVLVFLGFVIPGILKFLYIAWMSLGLVLGLIVAPLMFSLLYLLSFVPIGIIARLCGKKFLDLKISKAAETYWVAKPEKEDIKKSAENQF